MQPVNTVSRIQAIAHVFPDGTAMLSSHGRGPTLWRSAQGGPWNPLYKGESKALQNGDQISLDCNAPESAILACLQENAMGQGYGAQQQGYGGDNYGGGGGWGGQQGGYPQPGQW